MNLPTLDEMNLLHKKYAPSKEVLDSVWTHCHIVRRIAQQIADNYYPTDHELIQAGALLHDIGVYRLYPNGLRDKSKHYVTHGLLGYELLKEEGFDEKLCRFALLHTGMGITTEDIQQKNLPLPLRDYIAETDEEKIVMYADKFHSKLAPPTFNSVKSYAKHLRTEIDEQRAKLFERAVQEYGEPDLESLRNRYGHQIR